MQSELGMFLPMRAVVADRDRAQSVPGPMELPMNEVGTRALEATAPKIASGTGGRSPHDMQRLSLAVRAGWWSRHG